MLLHLLLRLLKPEHLSPSCQPAENQYDAAGMMVSAEHQQHQQHQSMYDVLPLLY